ncbi:hypothetical protein HFU84_06900 [Acidithiobacillus sp. CV18-2]|nr:hypothetical protein [Acidithiobacillus sp. CV18-3]MBU2756018.1 hypothetical protein [Acidithiobacillus sp. BN09-2]MBU2777233.1 hypothetical protein [Acidithiobacillus sp. CV18-2]MBU2799917.1 hypothetical protein [Acidithiobacillus sp. VAN18-4]
MKKTIWMLSIIAYVLLPVWMKIPVIGEYLAVAAVFSPMILFALWLFVDIATSTHSGNWENIGISSTRYTQSDLNAARQAGRNENL